MPIAAKKPPLPSSDKRWRIVAGTMRRHGFALEALIETLHTVQEYFGYLDKPSLKFVAASLRVPLSQAYGVATFYHFCPKQFATPFRARGNGSRHCSPKSRCRRLHDGKWQPLRESGQLLPESIRMTFDSSVTRRVWQIRRKVPTD
jgi:hypothetical protein